MGIDPHTSAVSPRLQHWDAESLFVAGAFNHPFNAGYNPTGPLGALALRLGDALHSYVEQPRALQSRKIGRAHVYTSATNEPIVCLLLLEKNKNTLNQAS